MDVRVRICREAAGYWSVSFPPDPRAAEFDELADGLAYAKNRCDAVAALIELFSDGIYVGVPQPEGWPHQLCLPASSMPGTAGLAVKIATFGRWLQAHAARPDSRR
jgi:hypothetical protein